MITDGNRPPHGKGSDDKHISRGMAREQMANKPKQEGAHVDHRPIWAFPPTTLCTLHKPAHRDSSVSADKQASELRSHGAPEQCWPWEGLQVQGGA